MESKKISFGFMKTKKVDKAPLEEKKEFIECVEEKSIKIVGGELLEEIAPLVIPMKPNTLVTAERLKKIAEEVESAMNEPDPGEKPHSPVKNSPEAESLDQMAVRELLEESTKEVKVEIAELTVPQVPSKLVIDGEKESTLEDYESVPVQDFGMAMLRGMGWKPNKEQSQYKQPQLRAKGLGLGADKVVSDSQKKKSLSNKDEDLAVVKNSFVKITTGKHNGYYGKVVSLDEDNGRVMVDIPIKKETVSLSEFMLHAVTKSEYDKESKVINAGSFEEYKKNEKVAQKSSRHDSPKTDRGASSSTKYYDHNKERNERNNEDNYKSTRDHDNSSNGRRKDKERHKRDSSSSEEISKSKRKKEKRRYSSNDSLSSLSDKDKRRKHKSSKKRYSSNSESSPSPRRDRRKKTPECKRDSDKKRKGKKKKRDRDRSPNYRKYKK